MGLGGSFAIFLSVRLRDLILRLLCMVLVRFDLYQLNNWYYVALWGGLVGHFWPKSHDRGVAGTGA